LSCFFFVSRITIGGGSVELSAVELSFDDVVSLPLPLDVATSVVLSALVSLNDVVVVVVPRFFDVVVSVGITARVDVGLVDDDGDSDVDDDAAIAVVVDLVVTTLIVDLVVVVVVFVLVSNDIIYGVVINNRKNDVFKTRPTVVGVTAVVERQSGLYICRS
jgi:hypothetical protein